MNKLIYIFLLSVAILFMATDNIFSQSYTLLPNDSIQKSGIFEDLETLSITQLNTTSNPIILSWKKVSSYVPANWEASVCDNSICNLTLVDSGTMLSVNPGDYGLLLLHITAHIDTGTAVIQYAVWDINTPSLKDTLTYIYTVNNITGITENEFETTINVSPNPVVSEINIITNLNDGFDYLISDIKGCVLKTGQSKVISLTLLCNDIANGDYLFTIKKKDGNLMTKKIIVQH